MDSAVAICFFLQKCRFFTVFFLNFGILRSSEIMLRGISRIRLISLALGILFSSEIFAFDHIQILKKDSLIHSLDQPYAISGAYGEGNHFFVVNDQDSVIYRLGWSQLSPGRSSSKLSEFKKLDTMYGYYSYAKKIKGSKKLDLEGVTSCKTSQGFVFYVVNEQNGDLLKIEFNPLLKQDVLTKLNIDYENFPDFRYDEGNDGFMGVTADCNKGRMFVAKQKNPNIFFEIDLRANKVVHAHDLSTGDEVQDDISDLFFKDNQLFILQKNKTSILVVNPYKVVSDPDFKIKNYDYSAISKFTTRDEKGVAEGLVVQGQSIYLFMDSQRVTHQKTKDVIVELKI